MKSLYEYSIIMLVCNNNYIRIYIPANVVEYYFMSEIRGPDNTCFNIFFNIMGKLYCIYKKNNTSH